MLRVLLLSIFLTLAYCNSDDPPTGPAGKALSVESIEDKNALKDYYRCILEDVNPSSGRLVLLADNYWMSRSSLAKWHGVAINENGRITELNLSTPFFVRENTWSTRSKNAIDQEAFPALTRLDQLRRLDLSYNFLQIQLEAETFDNLEHLEHLNLIGNLILPSSTFDGLTTLTKLEHLSLSVPKGISVEAICQLTNLKSLELHLQGPSSPPSCIQNLTNLESLYVQGDYMAFKGILFQTKKACPNPIYTGDWALYTIGCKGINEQVGGRKKNGIADSLTLSSIQHLTNLKTLSLINLGIEAIPPWIGSLTELEELNIPGINYPSGNPLTGPLPPELGQLKKIKTLHLVASGPLPPEIGDMESLESIHITDPYSHSGARKIEEEGRLLSQNEQHISFAYRTKFTLEEIEFLPGLEGTLPAEWGQLSNLKYIGLVGYISGQLPPEWGQLSNLETLYLPDLELTGPIPAKWGGMTSLETLQLENNLLSGPLPPEIGNMNKLVWLYLTNNQISGPIPKEIARLGNLEILGLSNNTLTGPLPNLSNMRSLQYLGLSANQLSGTIQGNFFPNSVLSIGLSKNDFSGPFPNLSHLTNLTGFRYKGNNLDYFSTIPCNKLPQSLKDAWMSCQGTTYDYSEGSS